MKFIIFEQLSCLAHLPYNSQPSQLWIATFVVILNLQFLAFMLPNDGWNLWIYSDGHFYLLKEIAQSSLLIPNFLGTNFDFSTLGFIIVLIIFASFLFTIIILVIWGVKENLDPTNNYKLRKFIFNFIMIITTLLQLPILMLFFSLIIISRNGLNDANSILNIKSILSLFTLLVYCIFTLF